jgi:hypothetical protein
MRIVKKAYSFFIRKIAQKKQNDIQKLIEDTSNDLLRISKQYERAEKKYQKLKMDFQEQREPRLRFFNTYHESNSLLTFTKKIKKLLKKDYIKKTNKLYSEMVKTERWFYHHKKDDPIRYRLTGLINGRFSLENYDKLRKGFNSILILNPSVNKQKIPLFKTIQYTHNYIENPEDTENHLIDKQEDLNRLLIELHNNKNLHIPQKYNNNT